MVKLGVNLDHVATIRQQRYTPYPDMLNAIKISESSGADSITMHLREDRRHIQFEDIIIARENITQQPDIFIQVSVPNEFQPVGKYNIGVTAGIETTAVSPEFVQGANKMDLLITTSKRILGENP